MNQAQGTKRAVIYLRVSTEQQTKRAGTEEGYSIEYQRDACTHKAESLGAVVVDEFVDTQTAKNADRPALQTMLERVEGGHDIDYVIVHKLDRLARNRLDDALISVRVQAAKAQLVSVVENIDDTPPGILMHGMLATFAEYQNRNHATEVMKGTVKKAEGGGTPYLAPIGYLNHRDFSDGKDLRTIKVDEERAPLVRWAFDAYATSLYSLRELLNELTAKGLTNRPTAKRPARPLNLSKLAELLRNPYYYGKVVYRGVEYKGNHEPLIEEELFDRVHNVLRVHDVAGARLRVHKHYLKGSLYCYRCGSRMGFSYAKGNGGVYPYFFCYGRQRGEGCNLPYLPGDEVEDQVIEHYALVQIAFDSIPEIKDKLRAMLDTNRKQRDRLTKRAQVRLTRLTHERDKLLHAYYRELVGDEQFKAEQDRISSEIKDARKALAEQDIGFSEVEGIISDALEVAVDCQQSYREAPEELRQKLNQLFFKRLRVEVDGIARTHLSDEMTILIGKDIAPRFERARRELVLARIGDGLGNDGRERELVFSGVGSSKAGLVEVRGFEPLTSAVRRQRSTTELHPRGLQA